MAEFVRWAVLAHLAVGLGQCWWSLWRGLMVVGSSVGGVVKELVNGFSRKV